MLSRVEWVCGTHSDSSCSFPECIDAVCAARAFARQMQVLLMLVRVGQEVASSAREARRLRSYMFQLVWDFLQETNDEIAKS